jgi:CHAD domain-containing protein
VTTRRLRASLWVLRHCAESDRAGEAHRDLRALGHVLGERRMWDIAARDAESYHADTSTIGKKRKRAHAKLRRALRGGRVDKLQKELRKLEKTIPALMLERLVPWLQGYEWELAYRLQLSPKTATERHELRIQAKKVRYVLECLGRRSAGLERLQDHLGREHDLYFLREITARSAPWWPTNAPRARTRTASCHAHCARRCESCVRCSTTSRAGDRSGTLARSIGRKRRRERHHPARRRDGAGAHLICSGASF